MHMVAVFHAAALLVAGVAVADGDTRSALLPASPPTAAAGTHRSGAPSYTFGGLPVPVPVPTVTFTAVTSVGSSNVSANHNGSGCGLYPPTRIPSGAGMECTNHFWFPGSSFRTGAVWCGVMC